MGTKITKTTIFEIVKMGKNELEKFTNRIEFDIWFIKQFGKPTMNKMNHYHLGLKEIGIDINDFSIVNSFSFEDFLGAMNNIKK